jgi:hypothetical protein
MSRRPILRRVSAGLLVPGLLLLGLVPGYQLFRCRYDGIARRSCCCPMPGAEKANAEAHVARDCCCDVQLVRSTSAPPVTSAKRHAAIVHAPVAAALVVHASPFVELASWSAWSDSTPRGVGPPLILQKHSFLI